MPRSLRQPRDLRVLILGWSSIVQRRVLPAFVQLGVLRTDVASATRQVTLPEPTTGRLFSSYDEALQSSAAELVYVSTRNHQHAEWTRRALESGRHVIVDKPAAILEADVQSLVALSRRQRRLIAEATVYGWHPQIAVARQLVADCGPVTRLTATFTFPPLPTGNYRYERRAGGGMLWDLGPYAVTPGRLFFAAPPEAVAAHASWREGDEVETAFSVLMRYPGQRTLLGHFGLPGAYVNRLELSGARFAITLERAFTAPIDALTRITGHVDDRPIAVQVPPADAFALFLDDVLSAMGAGSFAPFADAMLADADLLGRLRVAAL
jgi:dTDP-3,4-didehydro-2,6-dideoxy-alpha-D-glucose 3-reductase